jgi:hypothetical protein
VNKTQAKKVTTEYAKYGYYAVGTMEARMACPVCGYHVVGYLPKYAKTYASGVTYRDAMAAHLMEEH